MEDLSRMAMGLPKRKANCHFVGQARRIAV